MAHDPKLEIFLIRLIDKETDRPTQFRAAFRTKISSISSLPKPVQPEAIYREYYKHFLNSIDNVGYKQDSKRFKAIKIQKVKYSDGSIKSNVNSLTDDNFIIKGVLTGGKYNLIRTLGDIEDNSNDTGIKQKHVVGDDFYFLLYTPIDSSVGILLIQGYTEIKISDVIRDHIVSYFKEPKKIECITEIFVPESLKETYLKGAVFSSVQFTSGFIVKGEFEDDIPRPFELEIKVEITDISENQVDYKDTKKMIQMLSKFLLKFPDSVQTTLETFTKRSAKMLTKKNHKKFPIVLDDEDNIRPVILLKDEGISVGEGQVPNFDQIDSYCKNLLEDIIEEVMPDYAVQSI